MNTQFLIDELMDKHPRFRLTGLPSVEVHLALRAYGGPYCNGIYMPKTQGISGTRHIAER